MNSIFDSRIMISIEKINSISIDSLPDDKNNFVVTVNYGSNIQWTSSPQIFEIAKAVYNDISKLIHDYLRRNIEFQVTILPEQILREHIQSYKQKMLTR